jgi:adenosine kinase
VHKEKHTILVAGSLAYDKILDFDGRFADHILPDKVHNLSVSFLTENLSENFGGTAGNIAYNLALLGERPVVLATAGNDFEPYEFSLESKGVDLHLVTRIDKQPTAFATIMTDKGDNQIAAFYPGAAASPCAAKDEDIPEAAFAIIAPGNLEDMRRFPEFARAHNIPFIFDPGQQTAALSSEDIRNGIEGAKAIISNDYELAMLVQKSGWSEEEMLKHAAMVITTLGEEGSRIRTKDETLTIPAAKAHKVMDPTGAGDAYRAGLITGLLNKWPLPVAGRFAAAVAVFAVEGVGPQAHSFSFHEAWGRYTENFGGELAV